VKQSDEPLQERLVGRLLELLPDCRAIYRFGSWRSDSERPDSDIDLAVLLVMPLEPVRRWEIAQTLASLAGRDVDLVDLSSASTVLRMQVIGTGERLFCGDVIAGEQFDDLVFSSYARLNEERRWILSDVHRRGSVFG
jgi:uncharacterized protein